MVGFLIMGKTNLFIQKEKTHSLMGELENIAKELGDWVEYSFEDNIEILAYDDKKSWIGAVKAPKYKFLQYHVNEIYLDLCIEGLQNLDTPLSKRISTALISNSKKIQDHPNIAERFIGDYFPLLDFKEVPEIMKMHKKFSDD